MHTSTQNIFTGRRNRARTSRSKAEKYTQLVALRTLNPILHFLISSEPHAISIGAAA